MLIVMSGDEGEIAQPQPTLQIMRSIACNHANARVLPVIFFLYIFIFHTHSIIMRRLGLFQTSNFACIEFNCFNYVHAKCDV